MPTCPDFECLAHSAENCDKHYGCTDCQTLSSCDLCAKRETLVEGAVVVCPGAVKHS